MELFIIILLIVGCLIYQVAIGIPKAIKVNEEKLEMLKLQFEEVNIKLDKIKEVLDGKEEKNKKQNDKE